ncbi:uncharacterized protein BYT42DRAFT_572128 [Radiomyces spectabilis]|uniref:uncharacterized protein n=1 Tax=Radiomyces spectabilis TaxID=64574 RepID=UPI002220D5B2|nr:uncharacterized protein BYT42DRAFT_572128 [Radiomyces spectabilis]KAI8377906.1 hypothetical protein BYT42DRAFT_572128 [Radiomyces spectabilis]
MQHRFSVWAAIALSLSSCVQFAATADNPLTSPFDLVPDFRTPKNFAFVATTGGSSHVNWVLSIMNDLGNRGHNVTFFTEDDHIKFAKPYPNINVVSFGPPKFNPKEFIQETSHLDPIMMAQIVIGAFSGVYEPEYRTYNDLFATQLYDVVVCDHFASPCQDAARSNNIPFVVTMSSALTPDASAPYINNDPFTIAEGGSLQMSFIRRFYVKFILPLRVYWNMSPVIKDLQKTKDALKVKPYDPMNPWKDSLKLINNVFGIESPRPMGSLVELVGPIIPKRHNGLTPELLDFLNSHQRVAYVAFGQHAIPSKEDVQTVLTALTEAMEDGVLDGFVWSTVVSGDRFPSSITTSRNTTFSMDDMARQAHPHAWLMKWCPQVALLQHPSTVMFVSHGGLGSLHESLYAGKRLLVYPFFGDQPSNGLQAKYTGYGDVLDYRQPQHVNNELLKRVAADVDGSIQRTVERYQALVQIHSERGIQRGADLLEEVAFVHQNGLLPHRYEDARQMSWIKANNIDLYGVLFLCFAATIMGLRQAFLAITHKPLVSVAKAKTL